MLRGKHQLGSESIFAEWLDHEFYQEVARRWLGASIINAVSAITNNGWVWVQMSTTHRFAGDHKR
jgi:hypothetical protein